MVCQFQIENEKNKETRFKSSFSQAETACYIEGEVDKFEVQKYVDFFISSFTFLSKKEFHEIVDHGKKIPKNSLKSLDEVKQIKKSIMFNFEFIKTKNIDVNNYFHANTKPHLKKILNEFENSIYYCRFFYANQMINKFNVIVASIGIMLTVFRQWKK